MRSKLITEVLEVVRKEKIINKIIGILYRKTYHSKCIHEVVTIDDAKNLNGKYLKILEDKQFFNSIELGIPGKDFEPDQLIYLEYCPESESLASEKINRLCIFSVVPKKNLFSRYFDKINENNNRTQLIVIFNSKLVFKSHLPLFDINYHKKVYHDLDLLHMSPSMYSPKNIINQLYISKNGKPIDPKEHSEKLDKGVNKYLDSSKPIDNISRINFASDFYSSISTAKLNDGWVEGMEFILKYEFLEDLEVEREKRRKHILELERIQNEIYSEKIRTMQTSEENFDLGRFKK